MKFKKKNKKGAIGIILTTVILLIMWFFLYIIIDFTDYTGDTLINKTWDDSEGQAWYDTYGTYRSYRTDMKEILFPVGIAIIFIAGASAAYQQKVNQLRR